jgi:two-component system OmpR family sensor kinase
LRIIDLIDEAHDLLYMEDDIKHNVKNEMIKADFSTMSIVFKNLIDNAVKYGTDLEIVYEKNRLSFASKGDVLKEELAYYTEAFSKGEELNNRGFGLGLYIVNEILQKHEMEFKYNHNNGKNYFTISTLIL